MHELFNKTDDDDSVSLFNMQSASFWQNSMFKDMMMPEDELGAHKSYQCETKQKNHSWRKKKVVLWMIHTSPDAKFNTVKY